MSETRFAEATPRRKDWPAITDSTLAPRFSICSSTARCAPAPSATIVITAATPMMMPSMVKLDRSRLATMDSRATRTVSNNDMALSGYQTEQATALGTASRPTAG